MKENNISIKRHSFYIFIIFFSSFIISFSYPFLQYGVDGGLVLSNKVIYPDDVSPMKFYFSILGLVFINWLFTPKNWIYGNNYLKNFNVYLHISNVDRNIFIFEFYY